MIPRGRLRGADVANSEHVAGPREATCTHMDICVALKVFGLASDGPTG